MVPSRQIPRINTWDFQGGSENNPCLSWNVSKVFTSYSGASIAYSSQKDTALLKEGGFRAAGQCGWVELQQPIMIVKHICSDGLAPPDTGVYLICVVITETQLHCLYVYFVGVLILSVLVPGFILLFQYILKPTEGVMHVCLLMVL